MRATTNRKIAIISLAFVIILILFSIPFISSAKPAPQKPQPKAEVKAFTPAKTCGNCPDAIYKDFMGSIMSQSVKDPIFRNAYLEAYLATKGEAKKVCLNCHAPTVLISKDYDMEMEITKEGITCDF